MHKKLSQLRQQWPNISETASTSSLRSFWHRSAIFRGKTQTSLLMKKCYSATPKNDRVSTNTGQDLGVGRGCTVRSIFQFFFCCKPNAVGCNESGALAPLPLNLLCERAGNQPAELPAITLVADADSRDAVTTYMYYAL